MKNISIHHNIHSNESSAFAANHNTIKDYRFLSHEEKSEELSVLTTEYNKLKAMNLQLDMSRGKPGEEQLALSMAMLDVLNSTADCLSENGLDCRNYGGLPGIIEARKFFGDYMDVSPDEIIVTGSSSLNLMYDCLARACLTGVSNSEKPWKLLPEIKFLCPVPGYDRHFAICEFLGIKMINVPMNDDGVDMDAVEALTADDDTIKGIWIVPKYSNPTGICYSDETLRRLAGFKPKAGDFRIFCDNAYAYHHIYQDRPILNLLKACQEAGHPDRVYMFGSTNKITLPGAGVAFMAASENNIRFTLKQLGSQSISWDKMNMLRHVRFLKDMNYLNEHMEKHAAILRPKFDMVINTLTTQLESRHIGQFIQPEGGYFITYQAPSGCARHIVSLCREAGLILTDAGATHPYHKDPDDSIIRIAPSYPDLEELANAMEVFCIAVRMAVLQRVSCPSS